MKKIYLLAVLVMLLLHPDFACAQSAVLSEGFENAVFPPAGWSVTDRDADHHGWLLAGQGLKVYAGKQLAISYTCDPKAYPIVEYSRQDNWLITPQINITNNAFTLECFYAEEDNESHDSLVVRVSTTGDHPADFTEKLAELDVRNEEGEVNFQKLTRSLSKFSGQKIYIAFVHTGKGGYGLALDDITISNKKGPQRAGSFTVKPAADGNLKATLNWTNPTKNGLGDNLTSYQVRIYRDQLLIATLNKGTTTYTDEHATAGMHTYSIGIVTDEGESALRTARACIGEDVPSTVRNLRADPHKGKVTLTWTAPETGVNKGFINPQHLKYSLYKTTGGVQTTVAEGYEKTTFTEDIADGQTVVYEVAASNAAGTGEKTRANSVITYSGSQAELTVGMQATSEFTNSRIPVDAYSKATVSQTIYYPHELQYVKGAINHVIFRNAFSQSTDLTRPLQVYIGETDQADLKLGWVPVAQLNKVYDDTITMSRGSNDIDIVLSQPYHYQGKNLVVTVYGARIDRTARYADHFLVERTPAHANRSRLLSGSSNINLTALPQSSDVISEVPYTRFVMTTTLTGSLHGKVTDTQGHAIAGATVTLPHYKLTAITNEDGSYDFDFVPSGAQNITVSANGFDDYSRLVTIEETGTALDITLPKLQTYTCHGVVTNDKNTPLAGALVAVEGYAKQETTTQADGSFVLSGLYAGKKYTLTISKANYDVYAEALNATASVNKGTIIMRHSHIPAYAVEAQTTTDGNMLNITWKNPYTRKGRTQWTTIGSSNIQTGTSGDSYYSADDYCVAHLWDAKDIADSMMTGQSFMGMRIYLQAISGTFTAHVWEGDRTNHKSVAQKAIPLSAISRDGGWVNVVFDKPVEIKKGTTYMVGIHVKNASTDPIGVNYKWGSALKGKNNLKFTDAEGHYTYDASYAFNISAHVGIPGTTLPVDSTDASYLPAYKVYRSTPSGQWYSLGTAASCSYQDTQWASLPSGHYVYKVEAQYPDGASTAAFSNDITRLIDTDAGISAIVSPKKMIEKQPVVEVKAYIKNYGEKPIHDVPVKLTVNGAPVASATVTEMLAKDDSTLVTFGNVSLDDNVINHITLTTTLGGDGASSNDSMTVTISNLPNIALHAFRWDVFGNAGPIVINTNNPEATTLKRSVTPNESIVAAGCMVNGKFHSFSTTWQSIPQQYLVLDTVSWAPAEARPTKDFVLDMDYDVTQGCLYCIAADTLTTKTVLASVDSDLGTLTILTELDHPYHAFAINKQGEMYGITRSGDLYKIEQIGLFFNEERVGSTGITDVRYFQSMTFDKKTNRLLWVHAGENGTGDLYDVNTTTGIASLLGRVIVGNEPAEAVGLYTTGGSTDGIKAVTTKVLTEKCYNTAGQRVPHSYRGVVIAGGKKQLQK